MVIAILHKKIRKKTEDKKDFEVFILRDPYFPKDPNRERVLNYFGTSDLQAGDMIEFEQEKTNKGYTNILDPKPAGEETIERIERRKKEVSDQIYPIFIKDYKEAWKLFADFLQTKDSKPPLSPDVFLDIISRGATMFFTEKQKILRDMNLLPQALQKLLKEEGGWHYNEGGTNG